MIENSPITVLMVDRLVNHMKIGDIVVVSKGNNFFRAIGEITGGYEYKEDITTVDEYVQCRKVKWLKVFDDGAQPSQLIFKKEIMQRTLYNAKKSIDREKLSKFLATKIEKKPYVLIIDEINRGNISRIFGELITLIEDTKRKGGEDEREITLPYSKKPFAVPDNLYIIGTMNTADRSLTAIDLALRRRFHFVEMPPKYKELDMMLECVYHIKGKQADTAKLSHINLPIHEWIFSSFLVELAQLIRKGFKHDYIFAEEESNFLRGRLDVIKQLRQTPDRQTKFHIKYSQYDINRVENRLIKSALECILKVSKNLNNKRMATEYAHILDEISPYTESLKYLNKWSESRDMATYKSIRPWCEMILTGLNPFFQRGKHKGVALLFPMERIFESYVTHHIKKLVPSINIQAQSEYLARHNNSNCFLLKPDLYLKDTYVLDTKWKQLNIGAKDYGIDIADMRQMFAYGHKYLQGRGDMMLIYPVTKDFTKPLNCYSFSNDLHLWVVPFDLSTDSLIGNEVCREKFPKLFKISTEKE
ncbi:MAG: AAA family ATPase [Deferribacteraceae bacterium]|jgi:5-methylcytosine-specific restriction enzyme subunit McrC|nr:AAA family ATPase [Deferribacteraceae bacterium]